MIEPSFPKPPVEIPPDLLDFTPVPRLCPRHDGWTPKRQRDFIEALADLGSVRAAATSVNMSSVGAYYLRRQPESASFAAAWQAALALGVQRLEDIAMDRALHGVEVPVYAYGNIIGTRTVYNDALLMFILRNRAANRFNADNLGSNDVATRAKLERLKRQWRAEWEAEQAARQEEETEAVLASLDAKLELMRQRSLAARAADPEAPLTPEQLAAEAEAALAADRAANSIPTEPRASLRLPKPKPPRTATLGSSLPTEWLIHIEEGRIGIPPPAGEGDHPQDGGGAQAGIPHPAKE